MVEEKPKQEESQLEPVPGRIEQMKLRMAETIQAFEEKIESLKKKNQELLGKIKHQASEIKRQASKLGEQAVIVKKKYDMSMLNKSIKKIFAEDKPRLFIVHESYNGLWGVIKRKGDVFVIKDAYVCRYDLRESNIELLYASGDLVIPYDDMSMIVSKEMEVIDMRGAEQEAEEEIANPVV